MTVCMVPDDTGMSVEWFGVIAPLMIPVTRRHAQVIDALLSGLRS